MVTDIVSDDSTQAQALGKLGFIGYGSEELVKKEVGFFSYGSTNLPRPSQITLDLIGHGRADVYADIQGSIFGKAMYNSQAILDEIKRETRYSLDYEMQELIRTKRLSAKMQARIEAQASIDPSDFEEMRMPSREAARKMKMNAQELQRAMLSENASIFDNPDLLGMVRRSLEFGYLRETKTFNQFRGKDKIVNQVYSPILPYASRSAVDTEQAVMRSGDVFSPEGKILLGGDKVAAMEDISVRIRRRGRQSHVESI